MLNLLFMKKYNTGIYIPLKPQDKLSVQKMSIYNYIREKKDKNERATAEISTVMNLGNRNVGDFSFILQLLSSFPIFFHKNVGNFDINMNDAIHPTALVIHARRVW